MGKRPIRNIRAFTIVELMVVVSITAVMMAVMLPVLGAVRGRAKAIVCASNLRQLGFAFINYADDYDGFAMPTKGQTDQYWWGKITDEGIDHKAGFLWPYLASKLKEKSVYECPQQRFGSYGLQGKPTGKQDSMKWITSTYGYNGYYLCPPHSGWEFDTNTKKRPWQKITTVISSKEVFAFADTLIDLNGQIQNMALLDPPKLYPATGSEWSKNTSPTTCFRHNDRTNAVFVDGHCETMGLEGGEYTSPAAKIGSVGKDNAPHYVPDWKQWPVSGRRH